MKIIRKFLKASQLLFLNPKHFYEKLILFLRIFLPKPQSPFVIKLRNILFEIDLNYDPDILDMYYAQYQPSTVKLMKRFLKRGDVFLDVGANIGYISAVAMSLVEKEGEVHCFEPVPEYFGKLKKLSELNQSYKFILNECAVGEKEGEAVIAVPKASPGGSEKKSKAAGALGWSSLLCDSSEEEKRDNDYLNVKLISLYSYINEQKIKKIAMIKIDAEGYDFMVLKGMDKYLSQTNHKPVILCEIFPLKFPPLGYVMKDFIDFTAKHNYKIFKEDMSEIKDYEHLTKRLDLVLCHKMHNFKKENFLNE